MGRKPKPLDQKLRDAINDSGQTRLQIAIGAGVDPSLVGRFARGDTGITLANASKIMEYLGFKVEAPRPSRKKR